MLDMLHTQLQVGDWVVFVRPHVQGMLLGRVAGFTTQKVRIDHRRLKVWSRGEYDTSLLSPKRCVKVDAALALARYMQTLD
jgi:hypothetical protein